MRTTSMVIGALLFVIGLLMALGGAFTAINNSDDLSQAQYDWNCAAQSDGESQCSYATDSLPVVTGYIDTGIAVTVAGSGLAVCGAIFMLIGSNRNPWRPPAPPVPPMYPVPQPAGGPYPGGPGQPQGYPQTGPQPGPPTGPQGFPPAQQD
jgi:hypothetical protein